MEPWHELATKVISVKEQESGVDGMVLVQLSVVKEICAMEGKASRIIGVSQWCLFSLV